ncbi:nucleolar protein 58 [Octopus sinensis]|uniref:Nucleolar protein 58 n=1 Tax=Octopus sinensis TaxID=2607531 RepID=A0A6P7SKG1_9MOLL|nr:nucleolar protein 58 [Octopus sinensis]
MLVLFDTATGYAIFKLLDESKLSKSENLFHDFKTSDSANKILKLKYFQKFEDTTKGLAAITASVESKLGSDLKKFLKKTLVKDATEELIVADAKIGNLIKEKFDIPCVCNSSVVELFRCIRMQADNLLTGVTSKEVTAMNIGLAHSLSRYKLKFSPDKVDTMIVQAITLLDDLDKELNNYVMRAKEWYGWHFPELSKIVLDNLAFAKTVDLMGDRTNAVNLDFSSILPTEVEEELKVTAEISMGTEITEEDIRNIKELCKQIIEISEYRTTLFDYLKNRMVAIAPNLTVLVGEHVGARLIAHAGSLLTLAKHPSSTVQILGAEKALFKAIKSMHDTPKYGLIYHAALVSQTNAKLKGRISRSLAAKVSLAVRYDALGEDDSAELGIAQRAKVEKRLKLMEEGNSRRLSGHGKGKTFDKYENKSVVKKYDEGQDSTLSKSKKRKLDESVTEGKSSKKRKVDESVKEEVKSEPEEADKDDTTEVKKKKKKKKKIKSEPESE